MALSDYGPFGTVVTLVWAMGATFTAIFVAVSGKYKSWRPPDSSLPGRLVRGVLVVAIAVMVGTYTQITPDNLNWFLAAGSTLAIVNFLMIPWYQSMVRRSIYKRPIVNQQGQHIDDEYLVGGNNLRPEAEQIRATRKDLTVQQLLSGTTPPYSVEVLWERADVAQVEKRMTYTLMWVLVSAVASATILAFVLEVYLTNTRPGFNLDAWKQHQQQTNTGTTKN